MNAGVRRARSSWRVPESRGLRADVVVLAVLVVAALLVEVWQTARMAELSLARDRARSELSQQQDRLDFDRAELDRVTMTAQLDSYAHELELAPVAAAQVIDMPANYLAHGEAIPAAGTAPEPSWIGRAARAFVPEALAKSRTGH